MGATSPPVPSQKPTAEIERVLPDEKERACFLSALGRAVDHAASFGPRKWVIAFRNGGISLSVGRLICRTERPDADREAAGIRFAFARDLLGDPLRSQLDPSASTFQSAPEIALTTLPVHDFNERHRELEPAIFEAMPPTFARIPPLRWPTSSRRSAASSRIHPT